MSEDVPVGAQRAAPSLLRDRLEHFYQTTTDPEIKISDFKPISDGWETEVYSFKIMLRHQVESAILRMYPGASAADKCEREEQAFSLMMAYQYPVPLKMRWDETAERLGKPFLIMRRINGKPLGDIMRADSARQPELLTRFVQLVVDLHRLRDFRPDLINFVHYRPSIYTPITISVWRKPMVEDRGQTWAIPIFDWLDAHKVNRMEWISPLHGDFHPDNVLLTPDDKLYVIDWSGFALGDYRVDLAWTLLLVSTMGYPELRPLILSEYERISGHAVDNIEYFDVIAALKRLSEMAVSLTSGAESSGMRPETVELMRRQREHYQQVYALLKNITGLSLPEIERLIDSLGN